MKSFARFLAVVAVMGLAVTAQALNTLPGGVFTAGDLAVYRVGDGSGALAAVSTVVFVDEYDTAGNFLGSLSMTTGVNPFTATGNATSEGLMTLSADGLSLVLPGYDVAAGTPTPNTATAVAVPREVGVIGSLLSGPTIDTSTALTNVDSGGNIRGVASPDGTKFYITGSVSGPQYAPISASLAGTFSIAAAGGPVNTRGVVISGGNLLISDQSGANVRISQVDGPGLPTVAGGNTVVVSDTALPGTSGAFPSGPYAFTFLTLTTGGSTPDTMYVANDLGSTVVKYSLVGGTWLSNGTVAVTAPRGITATYTVVGGVTNVQIFGTSGISTSITNIFEITDSSGFNATISNNITNIAFAASNENFRGIAFLVPEPSTVALVGAGLFGLLALRRRRS